MAEETARANGIEIVYETIGDPGKPPVLLVMHSAKNLRPY